MSKHHKHNDDPTPGSSGKPTVAAGTSAGTAHKPATTAGKAARSSGSKKDAPWIDVASFVINFERRTLPGGATERRITAHKMQEGGTTAEWTGKAHQPLTQWIADHVGDWGDAEPEPAPPLPSSAVTADLALAMPMLIDTSALALAVTDVKVQQAGAAERHLMPAGTENQAESILLSSKACFDLSALVQFTDAGGEHVAAPPVPCTLQFFVRNTATQESVRLGEVKTVPLAGSTPSLAGTLTQISLPAATYRVASVALLKGATPKLAYAQGPLLEIV